LGIGRLALLEGSLKKEQNISNVSLKQKKKNKIKVFVLPLEFQPSI